MAIETLKNNPFADYGTIVYGDRFIGRREELSKVHERVLGKFYGNLAIIGLPRVGKSSLVWQAIMLEENELNAEKTIPIFFETGHCSSAYEFFKQMVDKSYEKMEFVCKENKFTELAQPCVKSLEKEYDKNSIQRYFRLVKSIGYKTIFVIDEFDRARDIFNIADFQLLRELSYNPEIHICLVTCSRKTIYDIEVCDGSISNFSGTFSELHLKMFSEEDVDIYWKHFMGDKELSKKYKDWIDYHTGRHPYLMDLINYHVFGINNSLPSNSDESYLSYSDEVKLALMKALDKIVHTLSEEKLLDAELQLIIGPMFDVKQEQIEKLLKYGVIRKVTHQDKESLFDGMTIGPSWDNYVYLAFSDFSSLDLYRRYLAEVPYFPLWGETENLLRSVVKQFLDKLFPNNWESEFKSYILNNLPYPKFSINNWDKNLASLKTNRDKMVNSFPNMRDLHLVDFTLTAQIFDIFIRPARKWFNNNVFPGHWDDWNNKFEFLTQIRKPISHNNPFNLGNEKQKAKTYCTEINHSIRDWQKGFANSSD